MKAVTLLVNSLLPPDLQDENRTLDKKSVDALLAEVARNHPDKYADIVKQISDIGRHASYLQGETLTLRDLQPVINKRELLDQMDRELDEVQRTSKNPEELKEKKFDVWARYSDLLEKQTMNAALSGQNNLANMVVSGARGNPFQLKAMLTTPALYTDYKDRPIPLFVRHSFSEGLRPSEYLASTFGVRKSVISTKNATADSGDLAKQMVQAAAPLIVTDDDCGTTNGIDYDINDREVSGRVLPKNLQGMDAGSVLDRTTLANLRRKGVKNLVVRSPLTCQAKEGVCAKCLGKLPTGKFAPTGYAAGVTAAQALSEPLTQGALNVKHGGGGFGGKKKMFAGFPVIDQLVQSPEVFPYRAAVSETEGKVESIEDAPQGGKFVTVAGHKHYVLPGFEPMVKAGDMVEPGDQLSEGVVDVADIVRHRGLGEARRYYVERLHQAFDESGAGRPSKTNLELMARAALDHVRIDDPDGLGGYLPDDLASYNRLSSNYSPDASMKMIGVDQAKGRYLQSPALHFTIGTKLTGRMVSKLKSNGFTHVPVSDQEPRFVPEMVRLRAAGHNNPDWLAKMHTSYLTSNVQADAARGRTTNTEENVHFAPRLAVGEGFGKKVETTGKF